MKLYTLPVLIFLAGLALAIMASIRYFIIFTDLSRLVQYYVMSGLMIFSAYVYNQFRIIDYKLEMLDKQNLAIVEEKFFHGKRIS